MRRILFAVDEIGVSGIVSVVNKLAVRLRREQSFEVSVLCLSISDGRKISEEIQVFDLNINRFGRKQRYLRLIPALKDFFCYNRFDSLVVCGMEFVPFYYLACRGIKTMKMIAWEHRNFNTYPKYRLEWFGRRIAVYHFDHVICLTKRDLAYYLNYQNDKGKIRQIYNISDLRETVEGYDQKSRTILSVGSLEPIKGFDMLIEVARKVFSEVEGWNWEIYGKGSEEKKLKDTVKGYGLSDQVFFCGFSNDIGAVYDKSSLYVMTSRAEGMPSVLVEAQRSHLPIVSFDIDCGPSDIIKNEVNGYLIRPYDIEEMASKIIELIKDAKKRTEMSEKSMLLHDGFDEASIIKKWKEVL